MTAIAQGHPERTADLPVVTVHGVKLHAISQQRCVSFVTDSIKAGKGGWIVTANLDHLRRLVRQEDYARLCKAADIVVADGMPLVWASRIQGTPLPERVAGSDLISSLSAAVGSSGRSVYLLGGTPGTAEAAAEVLRQSCPGLTAGVGNLPLGFANSPTQLEQIEGQLSQARPDIVYVALGSPKQEKLISALRDKLPSIWWIGVGISFSFLCGDVKRAPRWMRRVGLEWLHRLLQEPRRLAKRYLLHGIPFAARLLTRAAIKRATVNSKATRAKHATEK